MFGINGVSLRRSGVMLPPVRYHVWGNNVVINTNTGSSMVRIYENEIGMFTNSLVVIGCEGNMTVNDFVGSVPNILSSLLESGPILFNDNVC